MQLAFNRWIAPLALAAASLHMAGAVHAQAGGKPTILRVAYPAGGPADVAARKLQQGLQSAVGHAVIVENQGGAGGSLGATSVLNAAPDGRTLLVTTGNDLILAPLAISQVKYKPDSYRLLATILPTDFVLVSSSNHSFKSLGDLLEKAKAPGAKELSVGSWGYGSAPYLVAADFSQSTGIQLLDVPYKGAAPVMQALLTREIDLAFVPLAPSVLDFIRQGKIRPVGVANVQRNPYLPEVPTLNETRHLKDFVYSAWAAVFVPAATPDATVRQLSKQLGELVSAPDFQQFLKDSAALPVKPMTLEEAAAFYGTELEKFRRIAKRSGIEPQ